MLNLECLLKQPCLIILWHHQNPVFIHSHSPFSLLWQSLSIKFYLASSKPAWFIFSPFLMMAIIIKWILFGIIKTWNLHDSYSPPFLWWQSSVRSKKNIYVGRLLPLDFAMISYRKLFEDFIYKKLSQKN